MRRIVSTSLLTALFALTACDAAKRAAHEDAAPAAQNVDAKEKSGGEEPTDVAPAEDPAAGKDEVAAAAPEPEAGDGLADMEDAPVPPPGVLGGAKPKPASPARRKGRVDEDAEGEHDKSLTRRDFAEGGSVRAGEWNDNANYREFMRYLEAESHEGFAELNLRHRRFIVVRDAAGKGVPSCKVRISDGSRSTTLTTVASGRAILFPHVEGLTGLDLTATASCAGTEKTAKFNLRADDGVVDIELDKRRALAQQPTVEIAFILDTTGSMSEEIAAVKATIQRVADQLSSQNVSIRIALVEYKDKTDDFRTKIYPFTSNLRDFSNTVASIRASGGGDTPEDAAQGLHVGVNDLQWSEGAVARIAFLIGDAPPHLDYQDADYVSDMKHAAHDGIKVFTVAASGMDDLGQAVWRQVAQYTGATNMFVLRGGAGPQSTGGGDPKDSCGGTHQQFSSGNLDALIVHKVESELKSVDGDPLRIAGLGQDESAKPCDQRVIPAVY